MKYNNDHDTFAEIANDNHTYVLRTWEQIGEGGGKYWSKNIINTRTFCQFHALSIA